MGQTNSNILIILAAGEGKRMKSDIPKPMQSVGGLPLIGHILHNLKSLSFAKIIIVVGSDTSPIIDYCKSVNENIDFAIQHVKNGTGGAVKSALDLLDQKEITGNNFTVVCGDTPFIRANTIKELINAQNNCGTDGGSGNDTNNDISIVAFKTENPFGYGRLITQDKKLLSIKEETDASEEERKINLCNSGIISVNGNIFAKLLPLIQSDNKKGEIYLTDLIKLANESNKHIGFIETEETELVGINDYRQLAWAEKIYQTTKSQELMGSGVQIISPEHCVFSFDTIIGQGTIIEPFNIFKTGVKIGKNCKILSHSYLEKCEIKDNVYVGPYARIRPNVKIENNAKIGNFVEIKNSEVGEGSKISHLSYVGDSIIGNEVNIGAGTITCNYNGYVKNKTIIKDNVMVGSNSSLVAPVTIGKDAYIAAGSTITDEVPNSSLAINRAEQKNIADWVIKFSKKHK